MKQCLIVVSALFLIVACNAPGGGNSWQTSESGLDYIFYNDVEGESPNIGDIVYLNMRYKNENDSVVFTSFSRKRPMTFKLTKNLFKGALVEPLKLMSPGDSASFKIKTDDVFGDRMPSYAKSGETLTYVIKMEEVKDPKTYEEERNANRKSKIKQSGALKGDLKKKGE